MRLPGHGGVVQDGMEVRYANGGAAMCTVYTHGGFTYTETAKRIVECINYCRGVSGSALSTRGAKSIQTLLAKIASGDPVGAKERARAKAILISMQTREE